MTANFIYGKIKQAVSKQITDDEVRGNFGYRLFLQDGLYM